MMAHEAHLVDSAWSSDKGQVDDIIAQVIAAPTAAGPTDADGGDLLVGTDVYAESHARGDGDGSAFCATIFRDIPELLLPRPTPRSASPAPKRGSCLSRRPRKTAISTRSSVRLATWPSSVPVAEHAQQKLMHKLDFINGQSPAPDAVVNAFIDMYAETIPEEVVKALRAATRLSDKQLTRTLAAMAQHSGAVDMEVA